MSIALLNIELPGLFMHYATFRLGGDVQPVKEIFDYIILYWPALFLVLIYALLTRSLAKKAGVSRETLSKKAQAWVSGKKRAAREYILSKEGIALFSMLVSVPAYYWITGPVGFNLPSPSAQLFNLIHFMTPYLLFVIPACLALALKKITGLLLALPYLVFLGFGLLGLMFMGTGRFSSAVAAGRVFGSFAIACAVPAILVALLWNINETRKKKIYLAAVALQLVVLSGAVYYYTYHYGVWRLAGEPVSVQRLRLGDGELGFPLVEEDAAYIVDRQGRLYQVELAAGRKRILAQIPRPTPAEVGFPGVTLPPITRDERSPFFRDSALTRVNSNELSYRYDLIDTADGIWTMYVRINEDTGQVTWQLKGMEYRIPVEPPPVFWETVSQGRTIRLTGDTLAPYFPLLIEGEGIRTAIDPLGRVNWAQAKHGWILVGTNRGGLVIVTAKGR